MPYIKKEDRAKYDEIINSILFDIKCDKVSWSYDPKREVSMGELNYLISSIVWKLFDTAPSYTLGNNLVGMLECVKQEFYRRKLAELEDRKIKENGDI